MKIEDSEEQIDLVYDSRASWYPWYERIDPIYEIQWSDTTKSFWESVCNYQHTLRVDRTGHLTHSVEGTVSPITMSSASIHGTRAMSMIAMLHQWNQLSTLQLACLLGESRRAIWNTASSLYAAGILYRMVPEWWNQNNDPMVGGSGSLWSLDRLYWTTEKWFEQLNHLEFHLITNGVDPFSGSAGQRAPSALRHNIAGAELCIRAMESCPDVIGTWGEGHALAEMFVDTPASEMDESRNNVGDCVLVTRSGKVIVLELSGSNRIGSGPAGPRIAEKAAAWTAICGRSFLDLSVIFVDISNMVRWGQFCNYVDMGIHKLSSQYVGSRTARERGQSQIYVADSHDWFPITRGISTEFARMTSWLPYERRWEDVLDPEPHEVVSNDDHVVNSLAALHVPGWIKNPIENS